MSDADKISGATFEHPINGKTVKFEPLKVKDWGALKRRLQREKVEVVKESFDRGAERTEMVSKVLNDEIDLFKFIATTDGILKIVEYSLEKHHEEDPEINIDFVVKNVSGKELGEISNKIVTLFNSDPPEKEVDEDDPEKKSPSV